MSIVLTMEIVNDQRRRFGEIRDQGQRPTCLAMSASDLHGCYHGEIVLSAEYLFYQSVRRMTSADPHAGLTTRAVSAALVNEGQPLEADWPYHSTHPTPWSPPETLGRIWRGEIVFRRATVAEVIRLVESGVPLVLGLSLTTAFFNADSTGHLLHREGDSYTPHRHAVVGVGVARSPDTEEYVLVRNSWGVSWGLEGHAWLSVEYLKKQLLWIGSVSGEALNETH